MKMTQALGRRRGKRVYQLLGDGVAKALGSKAGSVGAYARTLSYYPEIRGSDGLLALIPDFN